MPHGSLICTHTNAIEHLSREHGERKSAKTSQQGVSSDGGSGKHQVRVDDVVHQLQENGVDSETEEDTSKRGYDPRDAGRVASPTEPEETDGERDSADHWPEQAPFRYGNVVVGLQFLDVARVGDGDGGEADHDTNDHANVRQAGDTRAHAVNLPEYNAVARKRQIQHTVHEGHLRKI